VGTVGTTTENKGVPTLFPPVPTSGSGNTAADLVARRHDASATQTARQRPAGVSTGRHTPRVVLGRWAASWRDGGGVLVALVALLALAAAGCQEVVPGTQEHAIERRPFQRRPGESVVDHCIRTRGQYHAGVIAGQTAEWCTWRRW